MISKIVTGSSCSTPLRHRKARGREEMMTTDDPPHPGSRSSAQPSRRSLWGRSIEQLQTPAPQGARKTRMGTRRPRKGRLGSPTSHVPHVAASPAGAWRASAKGSSPPATWGGGGHLQDGIPYKGSPDSGRDGGCLRGGKSHQLE